MLNPDKYTCVPKVYVPVQRDMRARYACKDRRGFLAGVDGDLETKEEFKELVMTHKG
jgi:hypothetical protein